MSISAVELAARAGLTLSPAQRCALRLWCGEPLDAEEAALLPELAGVSTAGVGGFVSKLLGRTKPRETPPAEMWICAGRRSGKTMHLGAVVIAHAVLSTGWEHKLAPGEVARIPLIAPKLDLLRQLRDGTIGVFQRLSIPHEATDREIRMVGRPLRVEPTVADNISVRGGTALLAVWDETALSPTEEGADGRDVDVLAALRPSLATLGGRLLCISSPWMREGVHYDTCEKWRGRLDGRAIALSGPTWTWHPELTEAKCRELESDPRRFAREYGGIAGETDENFLTRDEVLACVDKGVRDREHVAAHTYVAGLDVAFRRDRTALVICHKERSDEGVDDRIVVDLVCVWTPRRNVELDTEEVLDAVAGIARQWEAVILRDSFAGANVGQALVKREAWTREVSMAPAAQAARFSALAQRIRAGTLRLVDHDGLIRELCDLRVKLHQGGRVEIAAPNRRSAHDDIADALALAVEAANVTNVDPGPACYRVSSARWGTGLITASGGERVRGKSLVKANRERIQRLLRNDGPRASRRW